jgi:TPR repeat protein
VSSETLPPCERGWTREVAGGECRLIQTCVEGDADCDDKCVAGDVRSCAVLARGLERIANAGRTQEAWDRVCALEGADGCERAALAALRRADMSPLAKEKLARDRFERACEWGSPWLCGRAAGYFVWGSEKDPERARSLLQRSCTSYTPSGCVALAELVIRMSSDFAQARRIGDKSCGQDLFGGSCVAFGAIFDSGAENGGAIDPVAARSYFARGCWGGDQRACFALARSIRKALGLPSAESRAPYWHSELDDLKPDSSRWALREEIERRLRLEK